MEGLTAVLAGAAFGAGCTVMAAYNRGSELEAKREQREVEREQEHQEELAKMQAERDARPAPEETERGFTHILGKDDSTEIHVLEALAAVVTIGFTCGTIGTVRAMRKFPKIRREAWTSLMATKARHEVEMARFGGSALTKSLLPLLEEGGATSGSLREALTAHGLVRIDPGVGAPFDAKRMEASNGAASVDALAVEGARSLIVTAVLEPGYSMHGERTLRPAKVELGLASTSSKS